jgi:hypothetical protein
VLGGEAEYCIAKLSSGYMATSRQWRVSSGPKCMQDVEEVHRNFDEMTRDGQQRTVWKLQQAMQLSIRPSDMNTYHCMHCTYMYTQHGIQQGDSG